MFGFDADSLMDLTRSYSNVLIISDNFKSLFETTAYP